MVINMNLEKLINELARNMGKALLQKKEDLNLYTHNVKI